MPVVFAYPLCASLQSQEKDSSCDAESLLDPSVLPDSASDENEGKKKGLLFQYSCYALACVCALILAAYTVLGTHDYFAWNRARWQALNYAMHELRVSPALINGGYEFNHWFVYEPGNKKVDITRDDEPRGNDEYLISLEPIARSYELQKEFPFNSFFWGKRAIYLSRKADRTQP